MEADERRDAPSPFARSVGAAAACAVIGLLVCAFTYVARLFDFAPVKAVVALEDHLYDTIHPPVIRFTPNARTVVFVDIDEAALTAWGRRAAAPSNTPRDLIAGLTNAARAAGASVVFLDFDFRNSLTEREDEALREELQRAHTAPVLLPTFFSTGPRQACETQSDKAAPAELQTVFQALVDPKGGQSDKAHPSLGLVHPILALGAYGLVEGTCSFYQVRFGPDEEVVRRQAAVLRAVEIAGARDAAKDLAAAAWLPIRWTIGNDTDVKTTDDGRIAFRRIMAAELIKPGPVVDPGSIDLKPLMANAIVIIGSTAGFSNDTVSTPLGDIQGVLAHANLALSLESEAKEAPLPEQFAFDVLFIAIAAAATIPLCWRPTYAALAAGAPLSTSGRLLRLAGETLVILGCGVVFALLSWILIWPLGEYLAGWRFGLLSFIVGAIVVFLIEICSAVAGAAEELAELFVSAHERRRRGASRSGKADGEKEA